jgi:phospholipid/cholesterol/gamma-HCH transport system substrate-binding protein
VIVTRLSAGRLLAVVGFSLSCFGLLLYLWLQSGGTVPLKPSQYQVHVLLPQAKGLGPHSDVRVSGVLVGHVISVKAAKPVQLGRSDVLIDLEPRYVPLRADARAMLRGKSILGEAYVALSLGSAEAQAVPDGGRLAAANALPTVESDEIFGAFDERTRAAFREWMQTQGPGIAAHGRELNTALASLRPWMIDAGRLLGIVEEQSADVEALLDRGGDIAGGLADRGAAIRLLARSGDRAFNASGRQADALAAAFRELPGFEREARATLERMTRFASSSRADVAALRDELAPLSPALEELAVDAPALRTIVEATPGLSRAGVRGLPALRRVMDAAPPLLHELDPFLRGLNPALRYLADGRSELTTLIANLAAATQTATSTPGSREPVHYLRAMPVLGPAVLGPLSERPGASRANPYPVPELLDLAAGYRSWDTSHCGRPTPYIVDEPSPYIDQAQRDQIRDYAFDRRPNDPPRPACTAQGAWGEYGSDFPRLVADP